MLMRESGFTLTEVLVAMVVFAVGILAVLNMQLMSTATNVKSRGMTEGIIVAQNKIEELSSLTYNDPELADTDGNGNAGMLIPKEAVNVGNADHTDAVTNPRYTLFWNVEDDVPFTDTKTVRVIVLWTDKGINSSFSIEMVKSDGA